MTHGHRAVGGVKCAFLLRQPGSDSHLLPRQVLIKQQNAPARKHRDNYVATHGRVSADRPARGSGSASAAGAGSRAARSRTQGHLNSSGAEAEAWGARGRRGARAGQGPHRPWGSGHGRLRAVATLGAHRLQLVGAPLLPPPSPPLPGLASSPRRRVLPVPGRGWSSLSSAREWLPLRALSLLLLLHFSAPNAAAASCHRPSSQHGGGGGGGSCLSASPGLGELAPTFTATAPAVSSPARGHHVRHYGDHPGASREV